MFTPRYTITHKLLTNIKQIDRFVTELNHRKFPLVVLLELERMAKEVSTYASTSIEGNPLPLTEVKKILKAKPAQIHQSEQEILNYNRALQDLNNRLKDGNAKLSMSLILNIQRKVIHTLLPRYEIGHLRKKPVVVNDPRSGKIVYMPPDVKDVENLLQNLIDFIHSNKGKVDSLILAGIFHKQMVIIHPFMDGNGRTTRLATKVLLAEMGLNTFNLFSFENYYNLNVTKYFQTVGVFGNYYELVDTINFTDWLEYFTDGIIDELLRVQKLLPKVGLTPQSELQTYHLKILDFIRKKGFVSDRDYARLTDRARSTRALDLRKLIDLRLIERKGKGKATYYTALSSE